MIDRLSGRSRLEEEGAYDVHDWVEARWLAREGLSKTAISERLGMSRNTASSFVDRGDPPKYVRGPMPSKLDPFKDSIAAMLDEDEKVRATVVLEHLRKEGYGGGITIVKEHLATVRPANLAARSHQRTTYFPGELGQIDWWHTGVWVPVGQGATREVFGLVASLRHSAAHACSFTLSRTTAGRLTASPPVPRRAYDSPVSVAPDGRNLRRSAC